MTREEAKQMLPIIKAFSEGKQIQLKQDGMWFDLKEEINFDLPHRYYRIKPEPKYRPFKDAEECWNEMQKHHPFGWIYETKCPPPKDGFYMQMAVIGSDIRMNECDEYESFEESFQRYAFADGQPFGKLDEEE